MERPEKADYTNERCSPPLDEHSSLQARVRRVEQDVGRLHNRLELKTQELAKLTRAIVNSSISHCDVEMRLQRELHAMYMGMGDTAMPMTDLPMRADSTGKLVTVELPYTTTILGVLFESMFTFWAGCDPRRLPKSSTVARAIDERLGFSAQPNGEASRSAQAYASAIRPDWVKDADRRHHRSHAWQVRAQSAFSNRALCGISPRCGISFCSDTESGAGQRPGSMAAGFRWRRQRRKSHSRVTGTEPCHGTQ